MRLKNGDVRDHIVSSKIDQGPRSGVAKQRSSREVKRSTFARFLGSFDFRLLQQYLPEAEVAPMKQLRYGWGKPTRNCTMTVQFRQIRIDDTEGFRAAVDVVARERRYLALLEAPPPEQERAFVKRNVEHGYPQIVALMGDRVVGWCNVPPASRAVS